MQNPWSKASRIWEKNKPDHYVLEEDLPSILNFNKKVMDPQYQIQTQMTPVPFVGDIYNAEVFLLQLNPGADVPPGIDVPSELLYYEFHPEFVKDSLQNLRQKKMEYPFISLNPKHRLSGGFRYWSQKLRVFLNSPEDYKRLAQKICIVEFFPYHSSKFKSVWKNQLANSQKFSIEIVREALQKRKMVIRLRGDWKTHLKEYERQFVEMKNPRNVSLTEKNFKNPRDFSELQRRLR